MVSRLAIHTTLGSVGAVGTLLYVSSISPGSMRESPEKASSHRKQDNHFFTPFLVSQLKDQGVVVIDDVLDKHELDVARADVFSLLLSDSFQENDNTDATIRTDKVLWINETIGEFQRADTESNVGSGLLHALRCVRAMPSELVSYCDFDSSTLGVPLSNQLACYDGEGSFYVPHRDKPKIAGKGAHPLRWLLQPGLMEREITIILYLNDVDWESGNDPNMSGHLRIFLNTDIDDEVGDTASEVMEIAPKGGRMVIFDSSKILHEVVPTKHRRVAITCWTGGEHSNYLWLRPFCVPYDSVNWAAVRASYLNSNQSK